MVLTFHWARLLIRFSPVFGRYDYRASMLRAIGVQHASFAIAPVVLAGKVRQA